MPRDFEAATEVTKFLIHHNYYKAAKKWSILLDKVFDLSPATAQLDRPALVVWCRTTNHDLALTDSHGNQFELCSSGHPGYRMPVNFVAVFDVGEHLTNGVYHLRYGGHTNDVAELRIRL
ncbi:MAG TPA: hypothetical protein VHI52_09365 [Verrucomicrobiae bacterium]|nr:hypothetical protein [Verrucomicrobiae bacterium]